MVHHVLETLDLSHVDQVFLNLPLKFGRNGESYDIPSDLFNHEKLTILRLDIDDGPATKILPTIDFLRKRGEDNALVISVDDDIAYPAGLVDEFIFASVKLEKALGQPVMVGLSGQDLNFWGLDSKHVFTKGSRPSYRYSGGLLAIRRQVLEGYGAVGYRASLLNTERVRQLSHMDKAALMSDDITIALATEEQHVPKFRIQSRFADQAQMLEFPYGKLSDALHLGGGLKQPHADKSTYSQKVGLYEMALRRLDGNRVKYQKTFGSYLTDQKVEKGNSCSSIFIPKGGSN